MSHLANVSNNGIATTTALMEKLSQYGMLCTQTDICSGETGMNLQDLGLVADCPDAERGLLLRSPFQVKKRKTKMINHLHDSVLDSLQKQSEQAEGTRFVIHDLPEWVLEQFLKELNCNPITTNSGQKFPLIVLGKPSRGLPSNYSQTPSGIYSEEHATSVRNHLDESDSGYIIAVPSGIEVHSTLYNTTGILPNPRDMVMQKILQGLFPRDTDMWPKLEKHIITASKEKTLPGTPHDPELWRILDQMSLLNSGNGAERGLFILGLPPCSVASSAMAVPRVCFHGKH